MPDAPLFPTCMVRTTKVPVVLVPKIVKLFDLGCRGTQLFPAMVSILQDGEEPIAAAFSPSNSSRDCGPPINLSLIAELNNVRLLGESRIIPLAPIILSTLETTVLGRERSESLLAPTV